MELIDAYNFMKKIIDNAKDNNYKVDNVKKSLYQFLNILKEQNCLSLMDYEILLSVTNELNDIMNDEKDINQVFIEILCDKFKDLEYEHVYSKALDRIISNSCHSKRLIYDECGQSLSNSNNDCGNIRGSNC